MDSTFWRIWCWYMTRFFFPCIVHRHIDRAGNSQIPLPANSHIPGSKSGVFNKGKAWKAALCQVLCHAWKNTTQTSTWQRYKRPSRLLSKIHRETFLRDTTGHLSIGQHVGNTSSYSTSKHSHGVLTQPIPQCNNPAVLTDGHVKPCHGGEEGKVFPKCYFM